MPPTSTGCGRRSSRAPATSSPTESTASRSQRRPRPRRAREVRRHLHGHRRGRDEGGLAGAGRRQPGQLRRRLPGPYAFSTCYNGEEGVNLAEMSANEQDWAVVFDVKAIEGAVAKGTTRRSAGCRWSMAGRTRLYRYPNLDQPHAAHRAGRPACRHQRQALAHGVGHRRHEAAGSLLGPDQAPGRHRCGAGLGLGPCTPRSTATGTASPPCSSTARSRSGTSRRPSSSTGART